MEVGLVLDGFILMVCVAVFVIALVASFLVSTDEARRTAVRAMLWSGGISIAMLILAAITLSRMGG